MPVSLVDRLRWNVPIMLAWIDGCIARHADAASPLADCGFRRLARYYSSGRLRGTRIVAVPRVETPPLEQLAIHGLSVFEGLVAAAITYRNTIFVLERMRDDESLVFHELVHVVQWQALGPSRFLLLYGLGLVRDGYRDCPLEQMAYRMQDEFDRATPMRELESTIAAETERLGRVLTPDGLAS